MAKLLSESEIVRLIQRSLPEEAFAVAYFSRDRCYSYYTFDSIETLAAFLCDKGIGDVWLDNPKTVSFLIDEWFIFASEYHASEVFNFIKKALKDYDN